MSVICPDYRAVTTKDQMYRGHEGTENLHPLRYPRGTYRSFDTISMGAFLWEFSCLPYVQCMLLLLLSDGSWCWYCPLHSRCIGLGQSYVAHPFRYRVFGAFEGRWRRRSFSSRCWDDRFSPREYLSLIFINTYIYTYSKLLSAIISHETQRPLNTWLFGPSARAVPPDNW